MLPAAALCLCLALGTAVPAYGAEAGGREWRTEENADGTLTITGAPANTETIEVPSQINGKTVTAIGDSAFREFNYLKTVIIPDSVETIGQSAFYKCGSLASVSFGAGLKIIKNTAFQSCTALTEVRLPEGLTSLGMRAFGYCSALESVYIPASLTNANGPFYDCSKLCGVSFAPGITAIPGSLFQQCGLTQIAIPDSVETIGESAFYECEGLASVSFGAGLKTIGNQAFDNCSALKTVFYGGSEAEWSAVKVGSRNDPLLNASFQYGGQAPVTAVIQSAGSGSTVVKISGAALRDGAKVFAALLNGERLSAAVKGELNAASNEVTFQKVLAPRNKLFFLDPGTLVPLARPAVLS